MIVAKKEVESFIDDSTNQGEACLLHVEGGMFVIYMESELERGMRNV